MILAIIGYCLSFLVLGLWLGLRLVKYDLFPKEFLYILSVAASLLVYYFMFFVYLFHPGVAHYLVLAIIAVSPIFLVLLVISTWKSPKQFSLIRKFYIPPLLIVGAIFVIYNSLLYGCRLPAGPNLDTRRVPNVTYCAIETMPLDNGLPQMFGDYILQNMPTAKIITWSIADRPPLQIGATLPLDDLSRGDAQHLRSDFYNIFSIFLQLCWVGAVWGIFKLLKIRKRTQVLLFIGFCATQFFYINSIFVWPKLLSAGLALTGIAPYIGTKLNKKLLRYLPVAAVLISLGLMAHTGVVFTIIPFVVFMLYKLFKYNKLDYKHILAAIILSLIILVPWQAYQDSITTSNRLVKYQLANVTSASDNRGTLQTIIDSYKQLTFKQWADDKIQNVETLVTGNFKLHQGCPVVLSSEKCTNWRDLTFFSTLLGLEVYSLGLFTVIYQAFRRKLDKFDKDSIILIAASLLVFVLAIFVPGGTVVHQGSYITMILLFILFGRSLSRTHVSVLISLTFIQLLIFYIVWLKPFAYF